MAAAAAAVSLSSTFTTSKLIKPLAWSPSSLRSSSALQLRGGPRPVTRIAVARGGGRYYRRPSGPRRRQGDAGFVNPDYDPALDLDRIDMMANMEQEELAELNNKHLPRECPLAVASDIDNL